MKIIEGVYMGSLCSYSNAYEADRFTLPLRNLLKSQR